MDMYKNNTDRDEGIAALFDSSGPVGNCFEEDSIRVLGDGRVLRSLGREAPLLLSARGVVRPPAPL